MLAHGGVGSLVTQPRMAGDALSLVVNLNDSFRCPHHHLLARQPVWHAVEAFVKRDMLVDVDAHTLPLGIFVAVGWQRSQQRLVERGEQLGTRLVEVLHLLGIQFGRKNRNLCV